MSEPLVEPEVGVDGLDRSLHPDHRFRLMTTRTPEPLASFAQTPPLNASFPESVPPPDTSYPESFEGSRPYIEYRLVRDEVPMRIRLDQRVIDELVEHSYRSDAGWSYIDAVTRAVSYGQALKDAEAAESDPWGQLPGAGARSGRTREVLDFLRMAEKAQRRLSGSIAWHLVRIEAWSRDEVLSRVRTSTRVVAAELARFDPEGPYGVFADVAKVREVTPESLASMLRSTPFVADRFSPAFTDLTGMLSNLEACGRWAEQVRVKGKVAVAADVLGAAQGLIEMVIHTPLVDSVFVDPVNRIARQMIAGVQALADALSGRQQSTGPIPVLDAKRAIGETWRLAEKDDARAAQIYLLTQAATIRVFPIAARMDLAALTGSGSEQVATELFRTATRITEAAVAVTQEMGTGLTSLRHVGDLRPDTATGADDDVQDAFTYAPVILSIVRRAGQDEGSIAFAAAAEAMRERGVLNRFVEAWSTMNDVAGLGALLARETAKKIAPALAVSSAVVSVSQAIERTNAYATTRAGAWAVLEPSLRLVEQDPKLLPVFTGWGWAAVDVVVALAEILPLLGLLA